MTQLPKSRHLIGDWLNDLGLTNIGVEVGTMNGWFASDILNRWAGKKLYLIDIWRELKFWEDEINAKQGEQERRIINCFKRIYQFDRRAVMIREYSKDASLLFKDESLDFVYIDAQHEYEAVKQDIEIWYPKVKRGGILAGHDYLNGLKNNTVFGVKKAVDEWASNNHYEIMASDMDDAPREPSWYIRI